MKTLTDLVVLIISAILLGGSAYLYAYGGESGRTAFFVPMAFGGTGFLMSIQEIYGRHDEDDEDEDEEEEESPTGSPTGSEDCP